MKNSIRIVDLRTVITNDDGIVVMLSMDEALCIYVLLFTKERPSISDFEISFHSPPIF